MYCIFNDAFEGCTSLKDVYYQGSKFRWDSIEIFDENEFLLNATIHFSEGTTFALVYNANGGIGAPPNRTGSGQIVLSTVQPTRSGYTFLGWATNSLATVAQYAPGAAFNLTANVTLYAVWRSNDVPPVVQTPTIQIRNYSRKKTVDYKATVTFTAVTSYAPADSVIHWFINDIDQGTGESYTVQQAVSGYTIQCRLIGSDGSVLAESEIETITVKTGFFAKLKAFFRGLFGLLPKVAQEYLGVEFIDRVLP